MTTQSYVGTYQEYATSLMARSAEDAVIRAPARLQQPRAVLIVLLAFMYAGGVVYLDRVSASLLYAYYAVLIICSVCCLGIDTRARRNLAALAPYALWYVLFTIWTILANGLNDMPWQGCVTAMRDAVKAFIVWPALAAALPDRTYLRRLAAWVALAAAVGALVSLLIPLVPALHAFILNIHDLGYAQRDALIARPGGLWGNANQAGHAFLFAILLSYWAARPWRQLALAAGLLGLFLGASRQNIYLLSFCGLAGAAYLARSYLRRERLAHLLGLAALSLVLALAVVAAYNIIIAEGLPGARNLPRILAADQGEASRPSIAKASIEQILERPWYGSGAFSFRSYLIRYGSAEQERGCHDIYLAIWGEGGIIFLGAYFAVMAWGFSQGRGRPARPGERLIVALMWICFLGIGLAWHGQLGDFNGLLFVGLLFIVPVIQ